MLVLSRKRGESVIIGDDIQVVVTGIRSGKVSLGIQAPKNISVRRTEIYLAMKLAEKLELAAHGHPSL